MIDGTVYHGTVRLMENCTLILKIDTSMGFTCLRCIDCWVERMILESRNPINSSPMGSSSSSSGSLYDKLKALSDEISEGILNLTDDNKTKVTMEIQSLKDQAAKDRAPEVTANIFLFRKYAETANYWKDAHANLKNDKLGLIGELPSFVYETNDEELVGMTALKTNIFWLRLVTCILAFISYIVMSTVPGIGHADFNPSATFKVCLCYCSMKYYANNHCRALVVIIICPGTSTFVLTKLL